MKRRTYMTLELYDRIKADLDAGVLTRREIADKYDTNPSQVSRVASGTLKRPVSGRASRKGARGSTALEPIVFEQNGIVVADSRDVAAYFEKRHADVLRAIDDLLDALTDAELRSLMQQAFFLPVLCTDAKGETRRTFHLTHDGFALVGMGFTGPKALGFKIKYIGRYNAMEQALRSPAATSIDRAWLMDRLDQQDKRFDQICRGIIWLEKKFPESLINNPKFKKVMFGGNARTLMKRMRDAGMVPPAVGDLFASAPPDPMQDPWEEENIHELDDDDHQSDSQADSRQRHEPSPDPAAKGPAPDFRYRLPVQICGPQDMNFTSGRQMMLREGWKKKWNANGPTRSLMSAAYSAYKAIGGTNSYIAETDGQTRLPTPFFNKFMEDEGNAMVAAMIARYKAAHPDAEPESGAPEGTVPFRKPEKAKDRNDPDKPL